MQYKPPKIEKIDDENELNEQQKCKVQTGGTRGAGPCGSAFGAVCK